MRPEGDASFRVLTDDGYLFDDNLLAVVDVDARSSWHAVELNTEEVVVSVVGLSVNTNGADSSQVFLNYELRNVSPWISKHEVVSTSLLNLEV